MYQKITIFLLVALKCFSSFSQSVEKKDTTDTRHTLKEVEITAWQQRKILSGLLSGKIKLNVAELNTLPRFLGETDALRTMKLMPGVLTTGELNSGFYVRGSESSHNQILLNGAPIYN